jgi:hypothetical protein
MIHAQNVRTVAAITAGTIATNNTSATMVDTAGWKYAKYQIFYGNGTVTTKANTIKVVESTDSNVSNAVDIVACTGTTNTVTSTSAGFVIPAQASSTVPHIYELNLALGGNRRRYLGLVVASGNTATVLANAAFLTLSRGDESPNSNAEAGVDVRVNA